MKHFIFDAKTFDQAKFLETLGAESADVKLKNPDGTHTRLSFTPSGVSMTVEQFTNLCEQSPNKEFAAQKLESVKGLSPMTEVVIDIGQIETLGKTSEKASDAQTAEHSHSNAEASPERKEIPSSKSRKVET